MPGQFVGPRQAILYGNVRIPYSLYDAFTDTLAAGSVNGTLATPPDGVLMVGTAAQNTRVVTDANSKMSITGGLLSVVTGAAADSGLWYGTYATVLLGRTLLARVINNSGGANSSAIGWDVNQAAAPQDSVFFVSSGVLSVQANAVVVTVGTFVALTAYDVAVVQRAAGTYMFIKGGIYTNWTLIWSHTAGTTSVFPVVSVRSTTSVFTADNVRVPVSTFIPTPLAYDTFTRADAALGNSETSGPDAQATPSLAWTGTTYTISTNKAINTPTLGADVIVNGGFGTDTDWNKGTGWSIAAGVAAAVTATSDLTAAVAPLVVGTWYSVTYTLSGFGAGTVNAKLGSTAFPTHAANGTYTETGLALTTAFAFTGVGFTGSIDDVSCKPLTLSELFATMSLSTPNVMLDINCTMVGALTGKQIGIVSNLNSAASPTDFRLTILDGRGNVVVYDCIAGAYTVKATTAITYSAAAPLRVRLSSTALSRYYNNLLVGTTQTMGANTNTLCGLFSTSPLSSQDVWQAFSVGTSDSSYNGLDAL